MYKADRQYTQNKLLKSTKYDSLGRVLHIAERDYSGTNELRVSRFQYDRLGRLVFKGAAQNNWGTTHGTHYQYDHYSRIKEVRYPLLSSPPVQYCHGPDCNARPNFDNAGAVKDGYAVRDQKGYVSVYNYRAFGSPANKELIEIRQEIQPNGFSLIDDNAIVTTINRNLVGFINAVIQEGSKRFERTYTPHATAGSTTFLVKSETHPEFGTKRVEQYDQNGNVIQARNFNNALTTYVYDPMDRLRYAQNPGTMITISGGLYRMTLLDLQPTTR